MRGNYDSEDASNYRITLETCDPETSEVDCASEEEKKNFFYDRYLVVLMNENQF